MAPKRTTGKRSSGVVPAVERERRTKRRQEEETPPAPNEEAPVSPSQVPSMSLRPITSGRRVNFEFLRSIGLRIGEYLEDLGLRNFCSLNEKTYPTLVRMFYENLRLGVNHVESTVKGKRVIVSEEILQGILELPTEGDRFLLIQNREKTLKTVLNRDDVEGIGTVFANTLSLENRLLHNFICRIFLPRTGRFDWVSERDLSLMEHILEKSPVNLPYIVIMQMKEAVRKAKSCLPYGMMLTLLFKTHKVSLEGEDGLELHHTDVYSSKTLERMGYHQVEGIWRKKGSNKRAIGETSSEEEEEIEETPVAAATSAPLPDPEAHPDALATAEEEGLRAPSPLQDLPTDDLPTFDFTDFTPAADTYDFTPAASQPPLVSPVVEEQLKALSESLTGTITSLFKDLKSSVDNRLDKMEGAILSLQEKVEVLETARVSPQTDNQPILNCITSNTESLKQSVDESLNLYRDEVRSLKSQVGTMLETRKMEEDYTKGIGIIRSELGRLRGSAEAFANAQAAEMISMQKQSEELKTAVNKIPKGLQEIENQLGSVWMEMMALQSSVRSLEISVKTRPLYDISPLASMPPSTSHPRAPPPHSSFRPPHSSWQGASTPVNVPKDDSDSDSE